MTQARGKMFHLTCGLKKKKARTGKQPLLAVKSSKEVSCDTRCCQGRQGATGMACWLTFHGAGQTCLCPSTQGLHFSFPRQVCPKGTWRWPHTQGGAPSVGGVGQCV